MLKYSVSSIKDINYNPSEHETLEILPKKNGNIVTISFGLNSSQSSTKIHNIISDLRSVKDIIIMKAENKGITKDIIEKTISQYNSLTIIGDLCNAHKHGYPVKNKRSNLDPKVINIKSGLCTDSQNRGLIVQYPGTGAMAKNIIVFLEADIVDYQNNHISSFSKTINQGINDREVIINKFNLIS